jgi:hypothetical protein
MDGIKAPAEKSDFHPAQRALCQKVGQGSKLARYLGGSLSAVP